MSLPSKKIVSLFNRILIVGILFCSILATYTLVQFGSYYRDSGFSRPLLYFLVPSTLLIFLLISLKLKDSHKVNVVLVLGSIVFSIYVVEIFLFLRNVDLDGFSLFSTTTKLDRLLELRSQGKEAFPAMIGRAADPESALYSLGGIANTLAVFCRKRNGEILVYESDEFGFHNPKGLYSKPIEVITIGDSFTHGECVDSDENIAAGIRKVYPQTLNLGVRGTGSLYHLAVFREYAESLKPTIVLWFFYERNDLLELGGEKNRAHLTRYLEPDFRQNLMSKQNEIDQSLRISLEAAIAKETRKREDSFDWHNTWKNLSKSVAFDILMLRHLRQRTKILFIPRNLSHRQQLHADIELLRKILALARDASTAWGGELYFVYLPEVRRFVNSKYANPNRDPVLTTIRDLGIPVIDVSQAFKAHRDPVSLFEGHYTAEGYRLTAEYVLQAITTR